jgi:hypothetical protein
MFTKSVLYSSLLALALGKPVARRDHPTSPLNIVPFVVHDGSTFDTSSTTIQQFPGSLSFDGFGGLESLIGFDSFYGASNFCGVRNVLVVEQVVTCQVTSVTVIQQHLAVVAEYVKKVILTQSCETEAQVVLFSQWLGNLVGFGQDLRRTTSRTPTYDSQIASQLPQLVDVSGNINTAGFSWTGSSIGSHAVTIAGGNWNYQVSPSTIALTWESCLAAAGPEIPLGVQCSSTVCSAPVVIPVNEHVVTETVVHTVVEHTPITTVVEHTPVTTVIEHAPVWTPVHPVPEPPVHTIVTEHVPVWTPVYVPQPEVVVTTVVEHAPVWTPVHVPKPEVTVTTVIEQHAPVWTPATSTVIEHTPVHTIQTYPAPETTVVHSVPPVVHSTIVEDPHATSTVVEHPVETTQSNEASTETTTTEVPLETPPVENTGDVDIGAESSPKDTNVPPAESTDEVPVATTTESVSVSETATVSDSASVSETAAPETTTDAADSTSADPVTTTDASLPASTSAEASPFTVPTDSEAIPIARVRRLPPGVARRAWSSRRRV